MPTGSTLQIDSTANNTDAPTTVVRALRLRLKDKHSKLLCEQAREVNLVWNFTQELCLKHLERTGKFLTAFDVAAYTKGASKEGLSLHSQSVQAVSEEYVRRRKQFKRRKLSWRASKGARRSLGWIPFKGSAIAYRNGQVQYQGRALSLWDSYGLKDYELGSGSLSEDSRGRWYMNVTVKVKKLQSSEALILQAGESSVGIDLGLKSLLATSNGHTLEAQHFYRDLEPRLMVAQRSGNVKRTKAIHAKIANRRKDFLHKLSTSLVNANKAVFVGDVNASGLAKTSMAKSVLDSGWSTLRTMLQYKSDSAGVWFKEVNESYSTQECSCCHARTGPKGRAELGVRQWTCSVCSTEHDRDVNAARNIRQRGLDWLSVEFGKCTVAGAPKGWAQARADETAMNKTTTRSVVAPGRGRPAEGIIAPSGR
jgi:IS605 OrfB family transposase